LVVSIFIKIILFISDGWYHVMAGAKGAACKQSDTEAFVLPARLDEVQLKSPVSTSNDTRSARP
jgi:hypothetical protein